MHAVEAVSTTLLKLTASSSSSSPPTPLYAFLAHHHRRRRRRHDHLLPQDAKRIMPGCDVVQLLRSNPDMVLSLVKGKNLLPYDEYKNPVSQLWLPVRVRAWAWACVRGWVGGCARAPTWHHRAGATCLLERMAIHVTPVAPPPRLLTV